MQVWRLPLILIFIGGFLASTVMAQSTGLKPSTAAVRAEVVKVVQAQLTAFRTDDYEAALPAIRGSLPPSVFAS